METARDTDGPLPGFLSLPLAAALAGLGILLTSLLWWNLNIAFLPLVRLIAAGLGQLCWAAAGLICIIRGNIHAYNHISEDGPGRILYQVVKWTLVTALLFGDALLAERAYEIIFM